MSQDFSGKGSSLGNIFGFYKTRQILLSESAKLHRATCRRFDIIPACDGRTNGRTDGQTDGIAVASTALAKRRAVKKTPGKIAGCRGLGMLARHEVENGDEMSLVSSRDARV